MIVFDLHCRASGERFEAWFRSNADFDRQLEQRLVQCPFCASSDVGKAPMAPAVPRRGGDELGALPAQLLRGSRWVGERFPDIARAMHAGAIEPGVVHGQATRDEAQSLVEDEVPIMLLPLPVVPPGQLN